MDYYETKYRQQQLQWVSKQAAALNMQLVPVAGVAGEVSGESKSHPAAALLPRFISI